MSDETKEIAREAWEAARSRPRTTFEQWWVARDEPTQEGETWGDYMKRMQPRIRIPGVTEP